MRKHKRLSDGYRFSGFTPSETVKGVFGDPKARIVQLKRRQKNSLSNLLPVVEELLRPQAAVCARSLLWR
jgi:hypothetical protein